MTGSRSFGICGGTKRYERTLYGRIKERYRSEGNRRETHSDRAAGKGRCPKAMNSWVMEMEEKKTEKAWVISDELWEEIRAYIPERRRDPNKQYRNAPGQGRPGLPARQVLEGIFYVLRTGCRWKAVPREYGCGSSIHRYFQEWLGAGFFDQIWKLGVEKYDELEGISWEWKSVGGSSVRVPVRQELVGQMLIGHRKEERQGQGL